MIKVPLRFSYISTFFVSNFYENRRTTRITCSTVSLRFFRADAGSIASSSEQMERRIGKKASIPASLHWMASGVTQPEKAKTGLPYFLASLATAMGAFPIAVCPFETTLTGDDDIAVLDERFQRSFFQHDRGARFQDSVHIA